MTVTAEISVMLRTCEDEVLQGATGFLSFKNRRALLRSLGTTWIEEGLEFDDVLNDGYQMGSGHHRRARLALTVMEKALPVWEQIFGKTHPHRLFREASQVLGGAFSRVALREDAMDFKNAGLDSGGAPGAKGYGFVYAGYAAAFGADVVALDEALIPDDEQGLTEEALDDPEDADDYDCAAWAAAAHAGDFPWAGRPHWYHADKAREFWLWYLHEAVPDAIRVADAESPDKSQA